MSQLYKIAKGTILANKGHGRVTRPYKKDEIISSDLLSPAVLRELIADGSLIAIDKAMPKVSDEEETMKHALPPLKAASASGFMKPNDIPQMTEGSQTGNNQDKLEDLKSKVNNGAVQVSNYTPPAVEAPVADAKKWDFNPAVLLTKPLVELNAMILEREPETKPFEDKAEAIAYMSADTK